MNAFGVIFIASFFGLGLTSPLDLGCGLLFLPPLPVIVTNFGSKPIIVKKPISELHFNSGESVSTFCANGFTLSYLQIGSNDYVYSYENSNSREPLKTILTTVKKLDWTCDESYLETSDDTVSRILPHKSSRIDSRINTITVQCQSQNKLAVYQSEASLKDCLSQTYVVGAKLRTDTKKVAVCYDIEQQQLKFLSYVAHVEKVEIIEKTYGVNELDFVDLDIPLPEFETFFNFMTTENFNELNIKEDNQNDWYNSNLFIYENIVHELGPAKDVRAFGPMLNIVWFVNLYHGSWRNFVRALHMRSAEVNYNVRLGVSGTVEQPAIHIGSCSKQNETNPLVFKKDESSIKVPKYVWAYLKALQMPTEAINTSAEPETSTEMASVPKLEEFVIIGFNSPYLPSDSSNELCTDICHTIPWLNAHVFGSLRLLPSSGIMICCRIEEVAEKLENFPYTKGATYNFTRSYAKVKMPLPYNIPDKFGFKDYINL